MSAPFKKYPKSEAFNELYIFVEGAKYIDTTMGIGLHGQGNDFIIRNNHTINRGSNLNIMGINISAFGYNIGNPSKWEE